ncbi:YfaZ family outer membrane protein [Thiothrix lacustris]|uniref:YfaZ family outer membrane protein n=1 Tax=Thiothrix lacustris TaxID=525917 RepID=A0ABY9MU61_9GAMM|nr:YfaZ family outer membrane protein [Thiothrix lacustris]WML92204.1 YfaZ family outer membrane protein [Thiothrix lacustris]
MARLFGVFLLIVLSDWFTLSAHAATAVGTRITNQAEASYFDTASGTVITILSNYANLVVAARPAHQQSQDNQQFSTAGQVVYFPHLITNTGNVIDSYVLSATNQTGDNGDLESIHIYLDLNSDGQANAGEPEITETSLLQPGEQIHVVVAATVPNQAAENNQYVITLTSTSQKNTANSQKNIDTTSIRQGAIIRLSHITDPNCSVSLSSARRVYNEVGFNNTGNANPVERAVVVDGIALHGVLIEANLSEYFNLVPGGDFFAAPSQAMPVVSLGGSTWISYAQWDGVSKVEKVAVLIPAINLKPQQSGKFGYTTQVTKQPTGAYTNNTSAFMDENGDGTNEFKSNDSCNIIKPITVPETRGTAGSVNGIVFDSANLNYIKGATVSIIDVTTGKILGTTVSDESGNYQLNNISTGQYYLQITPPEKYTAPSINAPINFPSKNVSQPSYGQFGFAQTTGTSGIFTLDSTVVGMSIDIPLDRQGVTEQLTIEKTASKTTVAIGDLLSYTIKVHNISGEDLYAAYIEDQLPRGFRYLSGTAKSNDTTLTDPQLIPGNASNRAKLAFRLGDLKKDAEISLTYILQVTAAAVSSDGINSAYAHADTLTDLLITSPTVKAQVAVKQEGVLSDRAILFGRLAVEPGCPIGDNKERQENGWPLANVRLYMEDGTYVLTDAEGQFSLYGLQAGVHVLKVDNHTVPEGVVFKITGADNAGDPDSRFVDLIPGDFDRADFVAACPEAIKTEQVCSEQMLDEKGKEWTTRRLPDIIPALHFDSGKADIKPEYLAKLAQLIELTKDKQNVRLGFVGHTDNERLKPATKKKYKDNDGLSKARALEVAEYVLKNLGKDLDVTVDGKGESDPIADNATPEGMAQNRRVDVVLIYDEPVEKHAQTLRTECKGGFENVVANRILARSKAVDQGWYNEMDSLDPGNINSLGNLARQAEAAQDGDISNGLMQIYQEKVKEQQQTQAQVTADNQAEQEASMPLAKETVKNITTEQAKAGQWLWPLTDVSLDGRFMVVVPADLTPTMTVNGKPVTDAQLGEQIVNKQQQAQLMAWYGVELSDGENEIKVTAKDNFGNDRVLASKTFKRPSAAIAVKLSVDTALTADGGRTSVPVKIQVLDVNGYPAKGSYFLTMETSEGAWVEADIQDKIPGHQVKVTNGERIIHLSSGRKTGQVKIRASTGTLQSETDVSQIAEMRPLIAVGLLDIRAHQGYGDDYANVSLEQLSETDSATGVDGRTAIFMKGKVKGDMHLTLSYDNQKDPTAELLRDIDPEAYYEIYGDSSVRGYEAQSRSNLYIKLEKERHSMMWGDYVTDNNGSNADLAKTQRTLTGANAIYDDGKTRVQAFAARQDNPRASEEIAGNGTSMQYQIKGVPLVLNSEIIEIVTRDKANSGLLLKVEKLVRFTDYTIDEVTGYITFHTTVPTLDSDGNPVSIRISYDKDVPTETYTVAGVRAEHKVTDNLTVGVSHTEDGAPVDGSTISGAYGQYKDASLQIEAGVAQMEHKDGTADGTAERLQISQQWANNSRTELTAAQADAGFTNTSGGIQADRRELKLTHEQKITADTSAKIEAVDSQALSTESKRTSLELSASTQLDDWKVKLGLRNITQSDETTKENINTALVGIERTIELFGKKGSIKAEHEHELGDTGRQRTTLGAELEIAEKTKGYVRYENADRLASGTLAGAVDTQHNVVAGIKTDILPSTQLYSEYRIEGDISGQDAVAVNGAKATLNLKENLTLTPSLEVMTYLPGSTKEDSVAASVTLRDTRDKDSRKMLNLETRLSDSEKYYGLNGSYVTRLNDNVSGMVGNELRVTEHDAGDTTVQNTLSLNAAYRPKGGGPYNALYSYKWKKDSASDENTHILSTHQHYRVGEKTDLSAHVGAKQQRLTENESTHTSNALLGTVQAETEVNDRLSVEGHAGTLITGGSDQQYHAGAGIYYNVVDNVRVGAGYNVAGVKDSDLDPDGSLNQGAYVGLQLKVDEDMFKWMTPREGEISATKKNK